jgi:iron complex outermembrane receptor protein
VISLGNATPVNSCYNPQVRNASGKVVNGGPIQDIRNGSLPASPRWRGTLSPRYERSLGGDLEGFVQLDVTAQSQVQMAIEQDPLLVQPSYTLTDLTLGLRPFSERYQVSFFIKNVFDRRYFDNIGHGTVLTGAANPYDVFAWRPKDASRYVGGTVSVKF